MGITQKLVVESKNSLTTDKKLLKYRKMFKIGRQNSLLMLSTNDSKNKYYKFRSN